ncbi:MAG: response regulator [bacterium]
MEKEVMIVDDDPSVLQTCQKIISRNNIKVRTAKSGQECLKELEKGFKGIILMDIIMPEMDGWDTIEEIVNRGYIKNVIITMLTGKDQPGKKMDHLKEYVLDYIRKPFDAQDLINLVKRYLSYIE